MLYMKRRIAAFSGYQVAAAVGIGAVTAGVAGSAMSSRAASKASKAQIDAAYAGIDEQARQFDALQENYNKIRDLLTPYINAGSAGLDSTRALLGLNGNAAQQQAIDALKGSPQFTSALQAGQNAILQNASATGGLRGGNVQNALSRYSGDLLSSTIQRQIGNVAGLASSGQNAVLGLGSNSANLGAAQTGISGNIANLLQQAGAAQAGGAIAQGNALQSGLGAITSGLGAFGTLGGFGGASGFGSGYGAMQGSTDFAGTPVDMSVPVGTTIQ